MFYSLQTKFKQVLLEQEKLIACHHENVQPDILILGKHKGECIQFLLFWQNDQIMQVIHPGQHGSTFEGIHCLRSSNSAFDVVEEEKLSERAEELGNFSVQEIRKLLQRQI